MGCFSWLDCKTQKPVKLDRNRKVYVLVPQAFQNKFGKHIEENYYDGYGHFGGYDIYALVAYWNKEYLNENMLRPVSKLEDFGGLWQYEIEELRKAGKNEQEIKDLDMAAQKEHYDAHIARRNRSIDRLNAFRQSQGRFDNEILRDIGIDIACYDSQNAKLPFPIKITYDPQAVYEDCKPSKADPNQGF